MREIKFRAWDKVYKIMRVVFSIDLEKQKVICPPRGHEFSEWYNQNLPFNEVLILQNTGLKDKNGKEIYEGDIVKVAWRCDSDIGTVKYIRNGFYVSDMKRHTSSPLGKISATYEIIGNIYENTELVK